MNDEQRITNVEKEKNPRRVKAGKRLALVSKDAKEKMSRLRIEAEQEHRRTARTDDDSETPIENNDREEGYSAVTILTGIAVLTGIVCLYFTYKKDNRVQTTDESQKQPIPPQGNKLRSLDD